MIKFKLSLLLLTIIALNGCATGCRQEAVNKAVLINIPNNIKLMSVDHDSSLININDEVKVAIGSNCNPWRNVLCVVITPNVNTRVRLESSEFPEFNNLSGVKIKSNHVQAIRYMTECYTKQDGFNRVCNSSEESPVSTPVTVNGRASERNGGIYEFMANTFDSALEFTGAAEIKGSLSTPILNSKGKRDYTVLIIDRIQLDDVQNIVKFPKIYVNNQSYTLPDVKLIQVTESVCHSSAW